MCARGELDVATVPALAEALEQLIRESAGVVVVDLCDVDFLDSTGINVLVRARALLGRGDRELLLACPSGPARRVLELTGVADLFAIADSREQRGGVAPSSLRMTPCRPSVQRSRPGRSTSSTC